MSTSVQAVLNEIAREDLLKKLAAQPAQRRGNTRMGKHLGYCNKCDLPIGVLDELSHNQSDGAVNAIKCPRCGDWTPPGNPRKSSPRVESRVQPKPVSRDMKILPLGDSPSE